MKKFYQYNDVTELAKPYFIKIKRMKMKKLALLIAVVILFSVNSIAQTLKPGDGIRLTVYNIEDKLTGDYFVTEEGTIRLPYLGKFDVKDTFFPVLKEKIIAKYDSIYKNPEMTVQPLFRVSIIGEVNKPGVYYVTGFEKISDVLALAGGKTSSANLDEVYLIRDGKKVEVDAEKIFEEGNILADFDVRSGDKIFIPRNFWAKSNDASILVSALAVVAAIIGIFVN